jgi:hypothetical protein
MTAIEYRLMLHLPPAGTGREAPFPISVRLVAPRLYVIHCFTCNTHTAPLGWFAMNTAGLCHLHAHARAAHGESITEGHVHSPALSA